MHILFVSTQFPINPEFQVHGGFQRMDVMLEALLKVAHVDLLFYVHDYLEDSESATEKAKIMFSRKWRGYNFRLYLCKKRQDRKLSRWERIVLPAFSLLWQRNIRVDIYATSGKHQFKAFMDRLLDRPDAIFVNRLSSMAPVLKYREQLPPVILDLDDIEHAAFVKHLRSKRSLKSALLSGIQLPALIWGEHQAIRKTAKTFVCSKVDQDYLHKFLRVGNTAVVPNTIRIPPRISPSRDLTVLFLGSYNYQPNIDAAEYLIQKVWPFIRRSIQGAKLLIAGNYPSKIADFHQRPPDIEFTGFVKNLQDIYRRSRLVCAPIFSGGGTRIKIIEACGYGIPVVATTFGARGLDYIDEKQILLADEASTLSSKCLTLLKDYSRCLVIGESARRMTLIQYNRDTVIKKVQNLIHIGANRVQP